VDPTINNNSGAALRDKGTEDVVPAPQATTTTTTITTTTEITIKALVGIVAELLAVDVDLNNSNNNNSNSAIEAEAEVQEIVPSNSSNSVASSKSPQLPHPRLTIIPEGLISAIRAGTNVAVAEVVVETFPLRLLSLIQSSRMR